MKKLYAVVLFFVFSKIAFAQPFGNEWIQFSALEPYSLKPYLKIQVWQEGIHRITFNDINQIIQADTINPKHLQIFHNGKEQYIYVNGEADNVFDNTDYIEFYAKPNDGSFDTQLYTDPSHQVNPYYSLINDTSAYFLTLTATPGIPSKRMIEVNSSNFTNHTAADYVIKDAVQNYHDRYLTGTVDVSTNSLYSEGEGYASDGYGSSTFSLNLQTPNPYLGNNAPLPRASTTLVGTNIGDSTREWDIKINGILYGHFSFYGWVINRLDTTLVSQNALASGIANFSFTPTVTNNNENNSVPFIRVVYPHTLDFNGENNSFQKFTVNAVSDTTRLDVSNFLSSDVTVRWLYVFSGDTIKKINVDANGSVYQTLVPVTGSDKECLLTTDASTITTGHNIAPVTTDNTHFARFTNFRFNDLLDHDFLMVYHQSLKTETEEYKIHRSSIAGGAHRVVMADVQELYDQFASGINKHPLAIRNFCNMTVQNYLPAPKFLFLVGKSVRPEIARGGGAYTLNLVPTYGYPPSDIALTANANFRPALATGRIPARDNNDLTAYLDKVKEHDAWLSQPPQEWMKNVLHFGGGRDENEQGYIRDALNSYKTIIEDTLMAAQVYSFFKTSTDPIQANQSEFLKQLIDSGVSIMTFFSHAAGATFDITTDLPENYTNYGRYPIVIANSCYIGDIHTTVKQFSETFTLIPNKCAVGFIATPYVSYANEQAPYTQPLYRNIANYDYGKSIGECMQDAIDSVGINLLAPEQRRSMCLGMTLNGDPSLQFYNYAKPDLQVTRPEVFFTPANITTELDSFNINVVVKNLGRAINKPYTLEITRKYPDGGTDRVFNTTINIMPFADTISVTVPMDIARASGLNLFNVWADAGLPDAIDEMSELNNRVDTVPLLIRSSDINPVYPFNYSIVPNGNIKLKASTANLFAALKPYRFEIDTTDRFINPIHTATIGSTGGVVEDSLPFTLQANKVYYWRVANAGILTDTSYRWKESSFIYIPGKTGWSQAHYSQFKEDDYKNVIYTNNSPPQDTTFSFVNIARTLICNNTFIQGHVLNYVIDAVQVDDGGCYNQINMAVLDSITLEPWNAGNHFLGNWNTFGTPYPGYGINCGGGPGRARPDNFFAFKTDVPSQLISLRDAITSVPHGNYILLYSVINPLYNLWDSSLKDLFSAIGCSFISNAPGNIPQYWQPFILFTQAGNPSATIEALGDSLHPDIRIETVIGGNWDKGFVNSIKIGPSAGWSELHWDQYTIDAAGGQDSITLSVIGIDTMGKETVLVPDLPTTVPDYSLSSISSIVYPYLKLKAYVEDKTLRTPPQLKRWQIYYDEVPEAALAPNKYFQPVPVKDTMDEGDNIQLRMAIENISSQNMDSMLVDFYVYDKTHHRINISSPKYRPLPAGDTLIASVAFSSLGYGGLNSLWIEANPRNNQPEQYHFNNLAQINFQVNKDITNPLLDVTFDGQHILDGDIVSAKPFIFIKLKDENKFIALNDTVNYIVKLIDPDGKVSKLIFENAPNQSTDRTKLKWTPAVLPDNSFSIEYNPELLTDGIYQLEVQASDEAGNLSGGFSYKISFEIINRSTITDFINYPNPFSSSTKFVFTLTGSEIPTNTKIQIMTVTGKVVREIMQNELGPLHIGRNITEYAWDGRDEYGDQLANGIYLYRVITKLNGESIEHRQTDADKFFKKGYGKMYLLR